MPQQWGFSFLLTNVYCKIVEMPQNDQIIALDIGELGIYDIEYS
jgi:hypothetical protein